MMELSEEAERYTRVRYPHLGLWIAVMAEACPEILVDMLDREFGEFTRWFDNDDLPTEAVPQRACLIGTAALVMHEVMACAGGRVHWDRDGSTLLVEFIQKCRHEGRWPNFLRTLRRYNLTIQGFSDLCRSAGQDAPSVLWDLSWLDGVPRAESHQRTEAILKEAIIVALANTEPHEPSNLPAGRRRARGVRTRQRTPRSAT